MDSPVQVPPPRPGEGEPKLARGSALLRFRASASARRMRAGRDQDGVAKAEAMVDYALAGGSLDTLVENLAGNAVQPQGGDLDALADAATVSLHDAGFRPYLTEVEVSRADASIYVYMDERVNRNADAVLSVLGQLGEAALRALPADDPALGLYVWQLRPRGARAVKEARVSYLVPTKVRPVFERAARRAVVIQERVMSLLAAGPVSIIECAPLAIESEIDLLAEGVVIGREDVEPVVVVRYPKAATQRVNDALSALVLETRVDVVDCAHSAHEGEGCMAVRGADERIVEKLRKHASVSHDHLIDGAELLSTVLVDEAALSASTALSVVRESLAACSDKLAAIRDPSARRELIESTLPSDGLTPAMRAYLAHTFTEAHTKDEEDETREHTPSSTLEDPDTGSIDHQDPESVEEIEKKARELLAGEEDARTIGAGGPLVNQIDGPKNESYRKGDNVIRVLDHTQYQIVGLDAQHATLRPQDGSNENLRLPRAQWDSEAASGRVRQVTEGRVYVTANTSTGHEALRRHLGDRAWVCETRLRDRVLIETEAKHLPWLREKLRSRAAAQNIQVLS